MAVQCLKELSSKELSQACVPHCLNTDYCSTNDGLIYITCDELKKKRFEKGWMREIK